MDKKESSQKKLMTIKVHANKKNKDSDKLGGHILLGYLTFDISIHSFIISSWANKMLV